MFDINWQEIKEKYPKAFKKFIIDNNFAEWINNHNGINIYKFNCESGNRDEFICYCDLEKFFDNNGIIINLWWIKQSNTDISSFCYSIDYDDKQISDINFVEIRTRDEAKLQAVKKAFEIKNEQLKKQ